MGLMKLPWLGVVWTLSNLQMSLILFNVIWWGIEELINSWGKMIIKAVNGFLEGIGRDI